MVKIIIKKNVENERKKSAVGKNNQVNVYLK